MLIGSSDCSAASFDFSHMKFQIDGAGSPHPTTIDFDTSFDQAARKALHIQGLVPPAVEGFSKQERRCKFYNFFRSISSRSGIPIHSAARMVGDETSPLQPRCSELCRAVRILPS
jgi:hypothetical protein